MNVGEKGIEPMSSFGMLALDRTSEFGDQFEVLTSVRWSNIAPDLEHMHNFEKVHPLWEWKPSKRADLITL